MATFTDQLGRNIQIEAIPKRIISLVPSQTELLFDLGLDKEIVGVTRFCVHPAYALKSKVIVGGTKQFDFQKIDELKPDFIIGNKEENYQEGIERLVKKYPVWMSDIYNLEDACRMMLEVGRITGASHRAQKIASEIKSGFNALEKKNSRRVLYLIWRKPWMAAGAMTFINSMLEAIGLVNCLQASTRYPALSDEEIRALNPEIILLSSEPFPFKEKHVAELKEISPNSKIILADGEMFSWYGSRLRLAPQYFNSLNLLS
jgi:ABC-type Fe3+-hydroxamate transport system substrate-binding protein